jgi:hypothetical protein
MVDCTFATSIAAARVRVYAISDLHADYKPNMEWIRNLPSKRAQGDEDGADVGSGRKYISAS